MQNVIKIEKFLFHEFMMEVQDYLQKGWEIDFNTNQGFPTASIGNYKCHILQEAVEEDESEETGEGNSDVAGEEEKATESVTEASTGGEIKRGPGRPKGEVI